MKTEQRVTVYGYKKRLQFWNPASDCQRVRFRNEIKYRLMHLKCRCIKYVGQFFLQ